MHRRSILGAVAASFALLISACNESETLATANAFQADYAITGVNVVDVAAGTIKENQTVLVTSDMITKVADGDTIQAAPGAEVIDGTDFYLSPGLSDMHAHVIHEDELVLYLANGVTTIRNMWGEASTLAFRDKINSGDILGPRYMTAGAVIDGRPRIWPASTELATVKEAKAEVIRQVEAGYDFIKPYSRLSKEVITAIAETAKAEGIEVSGHIPQGIDLADALDLGMKTSEHFLGVIYAVMADDDLYNPDLAAFDKQSEAVVIALGTGEIDPDTFIDQEKLAALTKRTAAAGHWFVPTVAVMRNFTRDPYIADPGAIKYLSARAQLLYKMIEENGAFPAAPGVREGEDILYEIRRGVIRAMHDGGAKFMLGTDNSLLHGFGVVDEMIAMTEHGQSPLDVVRSASVNVADYMEQSGTFGEVKEGQIADLVLIGGNPLEDLNAYRDPKGVMRAGTWLPKQKLEAMLERIAEANAAILAQFGAAPNLPADMSARADFLHDDGAGMRIAMKTEDGVTTVRSARETGGGWAETTVTMDGQSITLTQGGKTLFALSKNASGWTAPDGEAIAADAAAIVTGTPMDILLLNAAAGMLGKDEAKTLAVLPIDLATGKTTAGITQATLTGGGRDIVFAQGGFEDSYIHSLDMDGDGQADATYWLAGFDPFGGGPIRYFNEGAQDWKRVL